MVTLVVFETRYQKIIIKRALMVTHCLAIQIMVKVCVTVLFSVKIGNPIIHFKIILVKVIRKER